MSESRANPTLQRGAGLHRGVTAQIHTIQWSNMTPGACSGPGPRQSAWWPRGCHLGTQRPSAFPQSATAPLQRAMWVATLGWQRPTGSTSSCWMWGSEGAGLAGVRRRPGCWALPPVGRWVDSVRPSATGAHGLARRSQMESCTLGRRERPWGLTAQADLERIAHFEKAPPALSEPFREQEVVGKTASLHSPQTSLRSHQCCKQLPSFTEKTPVPIST